MSGINIPNFLRELEAFYAAKGFQDCNFAVNQVNALLPSPDLEGRLTAEQLADALIPKIQGLGTNGNVPPWLRIFIQYCAETFGEDILIEKGIDPRTEPVVALIERRPSSIEKKGYYGPNNKKHIPRHYYS